jgi:hypothetical protein
VPGAFAGSIPAAGFGREKGPQQFACTFQQPRIRERHEVESRTPLRHFYLNDDLIRRDGR